MPCVGSGTDLWRTSLRSPSSDPRRSTLTGHPPPVAPDLRNPSPGFTPLLLLRLEVDTLLARSSGEHSSSAD
ncbi:unnamed protein product [Gadus morhua 'NCC']